MSLLAQQLAAEATKEVVSAGWHWRVRCPSSRQLLDVGAAVLLSVPEAQRGRKAKPEKALANPTLLANAAAFQEALVAAAIVAISRDGVAWEPLSVVVRPGAEEPAGGVVHISSVPPVAQNELFGFVHAWMGGADAAAALARFRRVAMGRARRAGTSVPHGS